MDRSDGTVHTLGSIDDPDRVEAIHDVVGPCPIVIADGHHRYETSLAYRDESPGPHHRRRRVGRARR